MRRRWRWPGWRRPHAIAEHTATTARLKVAELTVADADPGDTHSFVLSGTDANVFEVVGAALYLKQGTVLDYEDKASYAVTVSKRWRGGECGDGR